MQEISILFSRFIGRSGQNVPKITIFKLFNVIEIN